MSETRRRIRYLVAKRDEVGRLADRLGLGRLVAGGLRLDAAEVIGEDLRLHAVWPGVGEGWIRLSREDGRPRFCGTPRVAIVLEAGPVTRAFATVMRRIAASLEDATIVEVISWMGVQAAPADDLEWSPIAGWSGADKVPPAEVPVPADQGAGSTVAGPRAPTFPRPLREFFCDHAMQRKFYESFRFEGQSSFVTHGDIECSFITPRARTHIPRFFNYPWPLQGEPDVFGATTDLSDIDVINGGTDRLDEVVRAEVAAVGAEGPVLVNSTCVPTIIGDDVDGLIARHAGACAHGIYHLSPRNAQPVDIFFRYLEQTKDRFIAAGRPVRPGTVALVGFREEPARDELVGLLSDAGVEVVGFILPAAGERRLAAVLEAETLVFRPSSMHQPLYERLFAGVEGRTRISPEAPWGWAATAAWVVAVAEAAGRGEAARALVEARAAVDSERLSTVRERAKGHAIAFVIDPDQEDRVSTAHSQTGLPVVPVVREAGFKVSVLVWSGDAARFRDARDRVEAAVGGEGVEVAGFSTPEELHAALSRASAVFSEFFYDRRITRAGRGQVSARDFEMGFAGAVRTFERLLRVAELPFYRAHAAHLRPDSAEWWTRELGREPC